MQWILEGHTHVFSAIISSLFEIKIVYKIGGLYLYWVTYLLMLYNSVTPFCNSLSHFNENSILTSLSFNFMRVVNMTWMNDWRKNWHFRTKRLSLSSGHTGFLRCLGKSDTWSHSDKTEGRCLGYRDNSLLSHHWKLCVVPVWLLTWYWDGEANF